MSNLSRLGRRIVVYFFLGYVAGLNAAEPVQVASKTLAQIAVSPESSAPATVLSLNDSPIATEIDALVMEIPVRVGDRVEAGGVLVRLGCREFESDRAQLRGELRAIEARHSLAEWQLKQSQSLADRQVLPEEQLQERRTQLDELKGNIAAHAAKLEAAERRMGYCLVKAPFAGLVTERRVSVGQFAARGTPLVQLVDLARVEVSAQVPTGEAERLAHNDSLLFEHDGERHAVRLRGVLPVVRTETRSQEVRLELASRAIPPGTAGRLVWQDGGRSVPAEVLVQRDGQLGIFIESAGHAHFHPLPKAQSGRPAAVSLPPQTRIIVSGQFGLAEGTAVTLHDAQGR